jgi:hypothetical protein
MPNLDDRYESLIRSFLQGIRQLAREELAAEITRVAGGGSSASAKVSAKPAGKASAAKPVARGKGQKRSAAEIAAAVAAVHKVIKAQPGLRSEQIGKTVGLPKQEIADAIGRLLEEKSIKKKGVKRATKYFPA